MKNLLSADFARLKRDKFFWLSVAAMLIYTVIMLINRYSPKDSGDYGIFSHWSYYYFDSIMALPFLCALFISLYTCKDFDNKTIRNKAIAGHSKTTIYLSNLITSTAGSALIYITMLIGGLIAIPLFGAHIESQINIAVYIFIGFLTTLSIAALYTFISMLSGSRVRALIISMIVFFAAFFIFAIITSALWEPEFVDHHFEEIDGVWIEVGGTIPNPRYVSGGLRTFLECIAEFFPSGNTFLMLNHMVVNPIRESILSLSFTLVTFLGGIFAFCKKDMK